MIFDILHSARTHIYIYTYITIYVHLCMRLYTYDTGAPAILHAHADTHTAVYTSGHRGNSWTRPNSLLSSVQPQSRCISLSAQTPIERYSETVQVQAHGILAFRLLSCPGRGHGYTQRTTRPMEAADCSLSLADQNKSGSKKDKCLEIFANEGDRRPTHLKCACSRSVRIRVSGSHSFGGGKCRCSSPYTCL